MKTTPRKTSYNPHTLQVLEFDRVRGILASLADSEEGKSTLSEVVPFHDTATARKQLAEAEEIIQALRFDDPLIGLSVQDIRSIFPRLQVSGTLLEIEEIAAVADNLELANDIRFYFKQRAEKYQRISHITGDLQPHTELSQKIRTVITPDMEIADNASPELRSIRRKLQQTRNELRKLVDTTLAGLPDDVVSERIVTVRDGRYVIPVVGSMKKKVPGAIHDRSQTGKTFFIEPLATIEGNNNVRELELAESAEIIRIITKLSSLIADTTTDLKQNQDILIRLDIITAKARYGVKTESIIPVINNESRIVINSGRHPLLDWKYRKQNDGTVVVPLTIEIGGSVHTIVITGPNAGGKTVALKTLGLLTMMALSGIPVPAAEGTTVYAPSNFFADIGDEQSIENDLSTFSSHMKHIVTIVRESGPDTLVLLDELGAGTNPSDGEAIALATLGKLTRAGAVTLATSHHDGLKVFAHETKGVINASMDFDMEHHRPTFHLKSGIPGSSYAFDIAARMNMPEDVLRDAEAIAGGGKKSLEGLIAELEEQLSQIKNDREKAASERVKMETAREKVTTELDEISEKKRDLISEALAESKQTIEDTNRRMESLIKSLREEKASHEAIIEAKSVIRETGRELQKKLERLPAKKRKKKRKPAGTLTKGAAVWINSLDTDGVVEDPMKGSGKARILVGKGKAAILVKKSDLSAHETPPKKRAPKVVVNLPSSRAVSTEINLRGKTFDEARDELDMFLNDLRTSGMETAHIIHGKGTGALRNKIQKHLDAHEFVESWRLGNWNEGSFGVTVATLKKAR